MRFFFADDCRQSAPTRDRMSSLVGIGGFSVDAQHLPSLEVDLDRVCDEYEFPAGEVFKWSPGRNDWMRDNLTGERRLDFFRSIFDVLRRSETVLTMVASDTDCSTATDADTHEVDVAAMFLERAQIQLTHANDEGLVIVDRPGGGRREEEKFLLSCADVIAQGTDYVCTDRFALNVLSGSSRLIRCLQSADLVASASLARIGGETNYSPPIFELVKPLLHRNQWGCAGGTGLKLHPDGRFRNLYHWLLDEDVYVRGNVPTPIPDRGHPYAETDGIPRRDA